MTTVTIAPPNSVILVMDVRTGVVPTTMGKKLVAATESCIAVGCLMEQDGPTEITLARAVEVNPEDALAFDGMITTPSKKLSIVSCENEEIMATDVMDTTTRVRVYANDPREPNRIYVVYN